MSRISILCAASWLACAFATACVSSLPDDKPDAEEPAANQATDDGRPSLAEFTGTVDPERGTLTLSTAEADPEGDGRLAQALTDLAVDRGTGTAASNSVRVTVSNTRSGRAGCGRADSVCSDVEIRSYYARSLTNVYAEIQSMVPAGGNEAFNSAPSAYGLSDLLGLWSYGTLATAGASGDRVTRTWGFRSLSGTGFTFRGRIVGDLAFENYSLTNDTTTAFVNACALPGATTGLLANADDAATAITLPFAFDYYDYAGTSAWVSTNGVFGIGSTPSSAFTNTCMPSATIPVGSVMPFFDDLRTRSTGVCTATTGSYPNRRFVVTWQDAQLVGDAAGATHLTFSVVLNESGSTIDLLYGTANTTDSSFAARVLGSSATVGLWNRAGTRGAEYLCNTPMIPSAPFAIHFTPHLCATGQHRCGSSCVSDSAVATCGAACTACSGSASLATCDGYLCHDACTTGTHACGTACVSNTSIANCGTSCAPCLTVPNATSSCDGTSCSFVCNAGFHLCGGACAANTSTLACGASSCTPCPVPANARATCDGTSCGYACNTGYADCNGLAADGCEANLATDAANCGACGTTCSANNASPTCAAGVCTSPCAAGWGDCNGNRRGDGCETPLTTTTNCGACGAACSTANVTGVACTAAGSCTGTCVAGFGNCDGNLQTNGCETNLSTNASNCGACGAACSTSNVSGSACVAGVCAGTCASGYGNCDANLQSNGCEASLASTSSCGGCGIACSGANVVGSACSASTCTGTCASGYGNCDSNLQANGCETNLATDVSNCGACGRACSTNNVVGAACAAGSCTGACAAGTANCDANLQTNGCETVTSTDANNCGACGSSCSTNNVLGRACAAGNCTGTCSPGTLNCNGDLRSDGCECTGGISCCGTGCPTRHTTPLSAAYYNCAASGSTMANATTACGVFATTCTAQSFSGGNSAICGTPTSGPFEGRCACWVYAGSRAANVYLSNSATCALTGGTVTESGAFD